MGELVLLMFTFTMFWQKVSLTIKKTNKQECFNKDKGVGKGLEIYQKSNKLRDFNTVTNNIANTKNQIICMTILLLKIFGSLLKIVPQITNWGMFLFFIYHRKL